MVKNGEQFLMVNGLNGENWRTIFMAKKILKR